MKPLVIDGFEGKYSFLSNFYASEINFMCHKYKTAEHAYQAAKAVDLGDRNHIIEAPTPDQAKLIGRKIKIRSDWEQIKDKVMYAVVEEKFRYNDFLRKKLLDTGNATLIEGNWWHDNYWGDCHCPKCKNIPGQNHLGKILMQVREIERGE